MPTPQQVPPWEKYAAQAQQAPWEKYAAQAATSAAPEAPLDRRNSIQKSFDANTATNPKEPLLETGLKSVVGGIGTPFVHPIQTGKGLLNTLAHTNPVNPYDPENPVGKLITGVANDYKDGGAGYAGTKLAGNLFGQTALGEGLGAGAGTLARAAGVGGDLAQTFGSGTLNNAMGVSPKMTRFGQNPARGVEAEGLVPSLSKASLERKVQATLPVAGKAVGDAVGRYLAPVSSSAIANSIETPILDAGNVMSGFGGGRSTGPLADFWASTEQKAPGAVAPIYGPNAPSLVSPVDLWHSIQNIDKNTRFSADPEVEGVNEIRRDVRSGLRGNLEDVAPDVRPASQRYGDLRVADDALSKSTTPGAPKSLSEALSFPIATTYGAGLLKGGKLATGISKAIPTNPFVYTAPLVAGGSKNGNR